MVKHVRETGEFLKAVTRRFELGSRKEEVLFFSRQDAKERRRHFISDSDLRESFLFLVYVFFARVMPKRYWARWAHRMAGVRYRRHLRKRYPQFAAAYAAATGDQDEQHAKARFRAVRDARHRRLMLAAAEIVGRDWKPIIHIRGLDGVHAALARGNGAVIWCNSFLAQNLMGKRALHEAGLACHQVSVPEHGFTLTGLGEAFLNPLMVKAENKYLAERIIFNRGDVYKVTKRIHSVLRRNGVVLLTNNVYAGSSFAEVPIGKAGRLQLATTPVNLSVRGGAALFTMTTLEVEPFVSYEAVISPEITVGDGSAGAKAARQADAGASEGVARAMLEVRDRFRSDLLQAPDQFTLWGSQVSAQGLSSPAEPAPQTV